MARGFKSGGRNKGVPNRRTREVEDRLAELGCDPIALDKSNTPELRGRMYSELAHYVAPKRKAIEHSGDVGAPQKIQIELVSLDGEEPVASQK